MAGSVEFLGRLEHGLRAECGTGVVAGEQGLEFADDLLRGGFRDPISFDFQLERLLEERNSVFLIPLCPRERPRGIYVSFCSMTGLMGALRPQSPALLAAGAFGGNFQIGFVWRENPVFFSVIILRGEGSFLGGKMVRAPDPMWRCCPQVNSWEYKIPTWDRRNLILMGQGRHHPL